MIYTDIARDGSAVTPATFDHDGLSVGVLAGGEHRRSAAIRTAIHEALQQVDSPDHAPGVVIREFEKGYRQGDRLISVHEESSPLRRSLVITPI